MINWPLLSDPPLGARRPNTKVELDLRGSLWLHGVWGSREDHRGGRGDAGLINGAVLTLLPRLSQGPHQTPSARCPVRFLALG